MKKNKHLTRHLLVILLVVISTVVMTSCKSDLIGTNHNSSTFNSIIAVEDFPDIGTWHNDGLDYILGVYDTGATYAHTIRPAVDSICAMGLRYVKTIQGLDAFYLGDPTLPDTLEAWNNMGSGVSLHLRTYWSNFIIAYGSYVPNLEKNLIDTLLDYFDFVNNVSPSSAAYDSLINKANAFLSTFEAHNWSDTTGDLAGPALYIMRASAQYLQLHSSIASKNPIMSNSDNRQKIMTFLQADCAGYIYGWAKEVAKEIDNHTFTKDNEGKRIQAGVDMAMDFSTGYIVGKLFG